MPHEGRRANPPVTRFPTAVKRGGRFVNVLDREHVDRM
jgi:hypothetical protein